MTKKQKHSLLKSRQQGQKQNSQKVIPREINELLDLLVEVALQEERAAGSRKKY